MKELEQKPENSSDNSGNNNILYKIIDFIDKSLCFTGNIGSKLNISKSDFFDFISLFVKAVVLTALLFTFVLRTVIVDGPSMENTLKNEDRLIVQQLFYKPKRGDIVVVTKNTKADGPIIKRVIAIEGDKIDIDFSKGEVYLNDELIDEPYIKELTHLQRDIRFPQYVPPNTVFVMGDNRNNSHDSRALDVGMVELEYVMGKAFFRIAPSESFGKIE